MRAGGLEKEMILRNGDTVTLRDESGCLTRVCIGFLLSKGRVTGTTFSASVVDGPCAGSHVILKMGPRPEMLEIVKKMCWDWAPYAQVGRIQIWNIPFNHAEASAKGLCYR